MVYTINKNLSRRLIQAVDMCNCIINGLAQWTWMPQGIYHLETCNVTDAIGEFTLIYVALSIYKLYI